VRRISLLLDRWLGLFTALFLTLAGLTGAVIAWNDELDSWLNPQLFVARSGGREPLRSGLAIADMLEASEPQLSVKYVPLESEPGQTLLTGVAARPDETTGRLFPLNTVRSPSIRAGGRIAGAEIPGQGSAGDFFLQADFPLHSGRILGRFGRALVSLLGLVVAMLSVTGVLFWARKQRARATARSVREEAAAAQHGQRREAQEVPR
jgi:uncharacterized iron-regulated membrane protein